MIAALEMSMANCLNHKLISRLTIHSESKNCRWDHNLAA